MGLCLVYSGAVLRAGSVEVSADFLGDCDSKHATVVFMKSGKNFKRLCYNFLSKNLNDITILHICKYRYV